MTQRMHRRLFTIDEDTSVALKRWKVKGVPASQVVRDAVQAYTHWKRTELTPKPGEYDGVDLPGEESVVEYE